MESAKKILNNYDVLELIFLYLDFKEHFKLLKICPQFENAIVYGVWRLICKNLYICQKFPDSFLLHYNAENNIMKETSLKATELHLILHHSSTCIRKLELNNIRCLDKITSFKYNHLTELLLRGPVLEDTQLQQMGENCINLQSLSLISLWNSINHSNIRTNVFDEMKALKTLEITDIGAWNYFDVQQLFCLSHLKALSINTNIRDRNDNKRSNKNNKNRVYNIENLTIGTLPCLQSTNVCFIEDLIRFENLTELSITLNQLSVLSCSDNVLTQINNACPKLCGLSFTDCYFSFKEFPLMNNLMHLTFKRCSNIGFENFYDIFRKLKLKSLSLGSVLMREETEDISDYNYISNTLETLNIAARADRNIVRTFCNRQHKFENVSKVRLLENHSSQSIALCFSHSFRNLQDLIMDSFHISSEDILHMKHLKILQFSLFDNMSWSYLEILFKHPTLTHIRITPIHCLLERHDFEMHYERFPKCCEGLTTTLEYLSLPSVVYDLGSSFWPSFRQRNKLLKLNIVD